MCVQRSYSPAWVHANFELGAQKKQAFLAQHSVWKVEAVQEYPTCAPVTEVFVATGYVPHHVCPCAQHRARACCRACENGSMTTMCTCTMTVRLIAACALVIKILADGGRCTSLGNQQAFSQHGVT